MVHETANYQLKTLIILVQSGSLNKAMMENLTPTVSQNSELEDESLPNSQGKYLRINQSRSKLD